MSNTNSSNLYSVSIVAAPVLKNDADRVFLLTAAFLISLKKAPVPDGTENKFLIVTGANRLKEVLTRYDSKVLKKVYLLANAVDFDIPWKKHPNSTTAWGAPIESVEALHLFWRIMYGITPVPTFLTALQDSEIFEAIVELFKAQDKGVTRGSWATLEDLFYSVNSEAIRYKLGLPF